VVISRPKRAACPCRQALYICVGCAGGWAAAVGAVPPGRAASAAGGAAAPERCAPAAPAATEGRPAVSASPGIPRDVPAAGAAAGAEAGARALDPPHAGAPGLPAQPPAEPAPPGSSHSPRRAAAADRAPASSASEPQLAEPPPKAAGASRCDRRALACSSGAGAPAADLLEEPAAVFVARLAALTAVGPQPQPKPAQPGANASGTAEPVTARDAACAAAAGAAAALQQSPLRLPADPHTADLSPAAEGLAAASEQGPAGRGREPARHACERATGEPAGAAAAVERGRTGRKRGLELCADGEAEGAPGGAAAAAAQGKHGRTRSRADTRAGCRLEACVNGGAGTEDARCLAAVLARYDDAYVAKVRSPGLMPACARCGTCGPAGWVCAAHCEAPHAVMSLKRAGRHDGHTLSACLA